MSRFGKRDTPKEGVRRGDGRGLRGVQATKRDGYLVLPEEVGSPRIENCPSRSDPRKGYPTNTIPALALMLGATCSIGAAARDPRAPAAPLSQLRLYNPTGWGGAVPVEVPTGRLAAPGLVDWDHVRLMLAGREVPFAIREGRPHWKAELRAPAANPRAEDLLVFSCPVPPGEWAALDIVPGDPSRSPALQREGDVFHVTYRHLKAAVDARTGLLTSLTIGGEAALIAPMIARCFCLTGADGKQREELPAPAARLVSTSSTPAMTELNFALSSGNLSLALTYRIHSGGLLEVLADSRPWQGVSPWVNHAADFALPLAGEATPLPYLANRAPYYGFKDYDAAVKHPATVHRLGSTALLDLGEETTNGRRWIRRLYAIPPGRLSNTRALIELADEGFVIEVEPVLRACAAKTIQIAAPSSVAVAADTLARALVRRGVRAGASPKGSEAEIELRLLSPSKTPGLCGDGFEVRPQSNGIRVVALTPFGLTQGARRIAEYLDGRSGAVRLPLIAANPSVDLRAGGFGGGDFEVDFPYGTDAEWEHAFEGMISSGMNVMVDLGMWGNWKMPVTYKYMPELRSESPDAVDQASGARFSDIAQHRDHGLKLLDYLHRRGVKVWNWVPVGCVPSTYAKAHPDAMSPQNPAVPCFTHPVYRKYLEALAKEMLETYPLDGIVMIRDDNGGICQCERCKAYVAASRTKSPMWEQYLLLYDWLRSHGFHGAIAVYPYNDPYRPDLEPLLPEDLLVVGHGSGAAMLSRSFEALGPMGDTWIDNLYAGFRPASSPRMKRLLADRGSFWIGGAYRGTELPWESIGYFGWEPTATVNSFRYWWGCREFGRASALAFVALSHAYERLWDIYDLPMHPQEWTKLEPGARAVVSADGREALGKFRDRLGALARAAGPRADPGWLAHLRLFGTYFEYHLRRLEMLTQMQGLVAASRGAGSLPPGERTRLLALRDDTYRLADAYDRQASEVPGAMIGTTRRYGMMKPYHEWVAGLDALEWNPQCKQFSGTVSLSPLLVAAGKPFALRVELANTGVWPWVSGVGQSLEIAGDAARLGLPARWDFTGEPMAFGDRRVVELHGLAPVAPGEAEITVELLAPFRYRAPFARTTAKLAWR